MNKFCLVAGIIAAGFALAGLLMFLATGLFAMTGLHEFTTITGLWLIYKIFETTYKMEEV